MRLAASRALAAASLSALLLPTLGSLTRLEREAHGAWGPLALSAGIGLGAVVAILSALWVAEVAPRPVALAARRALDAVAAVPSLAWALLLRAEVAPRWGVGAAALGFFAVVTAPATALTALRALGRTPLELREASLALGASRWQVAWRAVVPAARHELVSATLFGAGHALAQSLLLVVLRASPTPGYFTLLTLAACALAASRLGAPERDQRGLLDALTAVPSGLLSPVAMATAIAIGAALPALRHAPRDPSPRDVPFVVVATALLGLPVVLLRTREAAARVPHDLVEAALALGASRAQAFWKVTVAHTARSVAAGALRGCARVASEAPLLLATWLALHTPSSPTRHAASWQSLEDHAAPATLVAVLTTLLAAHLERRATR